MAFGQAHKFILVRMIKGQPAHSLTFSAILIKACVYTFYIIIKIVRDKRPCQKLNVSYVSNVNKFIYRSLRYLAGALGLKGVFCKTGFFKEQKV